MLFRLPYSSDDQFGTLYEYVKNAYWPQNIYNMKRNMLPEWATPPDAFERLGKIRESLNKITDQIALEEKLYIFYDTPIRTLMFPFIKRYHQYFLKRQWEYPYRDPQSNCNNLFRLKRPTLEEETQIQGEYAAYTNCSLNYDNFNHIVNVVAAAARLIEYFKDIDNTAELFKRKESEEITSHEFEPTLAYETTPNLRTFKLLLAAFYHDIGKTVELHRHGMEGANILANHTTHEVLQLREIVNASIGHAGQPPGMGRDFGRDDLLCISHLVLYHDQFGTLGTGESSYLRLVDIVNRIRQYTLDDDITMQRKRGHQCLFDLWVLNVADILVSLERKYELQTDFLCSNQSRQRIANFLLERKAQALKHDLQVAMRLLDDLNKTQHSGNLADLEQSALTYAKRHAVERIRRFLRALLVDNIPKYSKQFSPGSPVIEMLGEIEQFSEAQWNSLISRCIYSVGDYAEFTRRLCWIGQMDYAFMFFAKIAERALTHVNDELRGKTFSTWCVPMSQEAGQMGDVNLKRTNAEFFSDNFVSTLVQMLQHLLFREEEIARLRNLEFWLASQRLTPEKIDCIISLKGPFRMHRAVQLALESIYLW